MKTLRLGSRGPLVRSLQLWYANFEPVLVDGDFGPKTEAVTKRLQKKFGLEADGVIGPRTAGRFLTEGWLPPSFEQPTEESGPYPPPPDAYRPLTEAQKIKKFGSPGSAPTNPKPGGPIVRERSFSASIVRLDLREWFPDVEGVTALDLHAKVELQWRALFDRIVKKRLAGRILSSAGSWNPRFIRGSVSVFSSHAFATAVDFNAPQNWLGAVPAKRGERGSLVEIVELLPELRMWWGGWFARVDGMHIESTATDEELGL